MRGTGPTAATAAEGRGQASLVSLAVALVLLTVVTALGLAVAEGALAGVDGRPLERRAAGVAADRVVTADSVELRPNVLDGTALRALSPADVDELAPPAAGRPLRVRLGGETVAARGDPDPGSTARRAVVVGDRVRVRRTVGDPGNATLTVPSGPSAVGLSVRPGNNSSVTTVRDDDRVVLHDPAGLDGSATVRVDPSANTTLSFAATGPNATVEASYVETRGDPTTLEVTVGAR